VSLHHGGGVGMGYSLHSGQVICCDGTPEAAKRIARVLWNDPATGVMRHADAGWDHYADKWQVIGPDGTVLGERVLAHPHDTEQPFTRSQSGITLPEDVRTVSIRAHDKVHGWGGAELVVDLAE